MHALLQSIVIARLRLAAQKYLPEHKQPPNIHNLCCIGREKEEVRKDVGRNRYFTPPQAIEYGLIDRIVRPEDAVAIEEKNYEQMLQQANAQQRGQQRVPAGASAEGGY